MSADMSERVLVIMSAHPELDEPLVDWLLMRETATGFSSFPIRGHSGDHEHLTIAEQVRGRQRRIRFEVAMSAKDLPGFLEQLGAAFGGADVHYWVLPILASRDLNSDRG